VVLRSTRKDFLDAVIGDPGLLQDLQVRIPLRPPAMSTGHRNGRLLESNFQKSKDLLKEAGYDGTPVVLMHSTDLQVLTNLAPVAKALMEKGGFKVDMQSMDWQTLVARRAKKDPPNAGGWNAFMTSWVSADILNPVMAGFCQRGLRQGDVRLAMRRADREAARPVRARDRSCEAERNRRCGAETQHRGYHASLPRPVVSAGCRAQKHRRCPEHAGPGVLERGEEEPVLN
jgi:hypothetical protein